MKKNLIISNPLRTFLIYLAAGIVIYPDPTYAYLDPGIGSYVIQIIIGTFLGAGYIIGIYWRRIIGFFKRHKTNGKSKK